VPASRGACSAVQAGASVHPYADMRFFFFICFLPICVECCSSKRSRQAHGNRVLAARPGPALVTVVPWFCFADDDYGQLQLLVRIYVRYITLHSNSPTCNWKEPRIETACRRRCRLWIQEEARALFTQKSKTFQDFLLN